MSDPNHPADLPRIGVLARAPNIDAAHARALAAVLREGHVVPGIRPSREILHYLLEIEEPRDRLLLNPRQSLRLVTAVARFVWMVAANDRLADIAFYEPKVAAYSDDGLVVPGSAYGRRLFQPKPGLDQIAGVVGRLRTDLDSAGDARRDGGVRRAAAVIWEPEDAVRDSSDVPCAFGMFFHVRGGELVTTLVMRSNNALTLLPWNVFEFSMVAEIVAASADIELGPLLYQGVSMHVYEDAVARAEGILDGYEQIAGRSRRPMPPMPRKPAPMAQARELARLEAALRHELVAVRDETPEDLLARGASLDSWWRDLYRLLLVHALVKVGRFGAAEQVAHELPEHFEPEARRHVARARDEAGRPAPPPRLELVDESGPDDPAAAFDALCEALEREDDRPLTRVEHLELRRVHLEAVAARGRDFSVAQFRETLRLFRAKRNG